MLESLWTQLLDSLSRKLTPGVVEKWVRPCRLVALEGDHLRIGAPNVFIRDWLAQNHLDALQHAAEECVGGHPRVSLVVDDAAGAGAGAEPEKSPPRTLTEGNEKVRVRARRSRNPS